MAKRTKRATRNLEARGNRPTRAKTPKRQAAKRLVKAKPKRLITKPKPKRSVAKRPTQPSALQTETTIVDVIEEPAPGVVVVTEFEETHTRTPGTTKRPESEKE